MQPTIAGGILWTICHPKKHSCLDVIKPRNLSKSTQSWAFVDLHESYGRSNFFINANQHPEDLLVTSLHHVQSSSKKHIMNTYRKNIIKYIRKRHGQQGRQRNGSHWLGVRAILPFLQNMLLNLGTGHYIHVWYIIFCPQNLVDKKITFAISEKTFAETIHYIPKVLRKGNPFHGPFAQLSCVCVSKLKALESISARNHLKQTLEVRH